MSDGATGGDWIERLGDNSHCVDGYAKQVLRSPRFEPTNGVTTEVAVLKDVFFEDNDRITKNIRAEADKRKLSKPNAELACLIREKFTDKEIEAMGLTRIVVMHEQVNVSDGNPYLLGVHRYGVALPLRLSAYNGGPDAKQFYGGGFAFAVSPA